MYFSLTYTQHWLKCLDTFAVLTATLKYILWSDAIPLQPHSGKSFREKIIFGLRSLSLFYFSRNKHKKIFRISSWSAVSALALDSSNLNPATQASSKRIPYFETKFHFQFTWSLSPWTRRCVGFANSWEKTSQEDPKNKVERRDFIKTTDHAAEALMQPPIRRLRRSTSSFITRRQSLSLSSTKVSQLFVGRLVAVMQRKEKFDLATELLSMPLQVSKVYLYMLFRVFVCMHVFLIYLFVCTIFVLQNFAWCSYVIRVHVPE